MSIINPKVVKWFERRKIPVSALAETGVYSGEFVYDEEQDSRMAVPSETGEVIVFPYLEQGVEVGAKYRAPGKQFSQKKNGRKTFFNQKILYEPALIEGSQALIITEGEIDALAVISAGNRYVVSVPDGAPPARDFHGNLIVVPRDTKDIDPDHDDKYQYINNNWDAIQKIKRIIVASDGDEAGRRLAEELVRRLGRVRCYFVEYPQQEVVKTDKGLRACKDMNEVLVHFGESEVNRIISNAMPYPVSGVYKLSEYPAEPPLQLFTTGWSILDEYLKPYYPCLMVVTGAAGAGKSTWTMQMVSQIAMLHGYNIAVASFEMRLRPYVLNALMAPKLRKSKEDWTREDIERGEMWVESKFTFIAPDPELEEDTSVDWLLERAATAVIRNGARVLLIDPWNELEHARRRDETQTEYVGNALKKIKRFARAYGVMVILVAHPSKGSASKGSDMSLYDVSDSAHFANKPDFGVTITRKGDPAISFISEINIKKVRYQPETGRLTTVEMMFDVGQGLFIRRDGRDDTPEAPAEPRQRPRQGLEGVVPLPRNPYDEKGASEAAKAFYDDADF